MVKRTILKIAWWIMIGYCFLFGVFMVYGGVLLIFHISTTQVIQELANNPRKMAEFIIGVYGGLCLLLGAWILTNLADVVKKRKR